MQIERPRQQPRSAGGRAVLPHRFHGALINSWIANQSQVIVRGQHQHLTSLGLHPRSGPAFERYLERVESGAASAPHKIEDAARAGIDEAVLLEASLLVGSEETVELIARCGCEASTEV